MSTHTTMKKSYYLAAGAVLGSLLTAGAYAVATAAAAPDPVKQSPQLYKVLLDNEHVRVLEYRLKPGEKEPMHTHTSGVVYEFSNSKLKVTQDGKTQDVDGKAGEVFWRDPTTHMIENVGNTEAHALAIELKGMAAK